MKLVTGLHEIRDSDSARVGGKALALAVLERAGRPIPQTICLTTDAYELFVERGQLRAVIRQELNRKRFADMRWEEVWDTALRIRNRFLRTAIPGEIVAALESALPARLCRLPVAVRSSAPGEDSEGSSFAGLHDSFVGVQGLQEILRAVRGVWASLWTDRALLYRRELGIDVDSSSMAVLVQELIQGTSSGIGFGVHPAEPAWMAVEAVYGLNQGLVDGTIEPDRWGLDRASGRVVEHQAPADRKRLAVRGGESVVEAVPAEQATKPPVDEQGLAAVYGAVRSCGEQFGSPQDVEWTLAEGRLVLLQSRPITTAATDEGDKRAWYLSLTRSLENLKALRTRVEDDLLPAMDREAEALAERDPAGLDDSALADEIERRREAHDRWVDIYSREFIPLAHGVRLFGQFYNETVRPEDPYEFMGLLLATPMLSVRRNQALMRLAARIRDDESLRAVLEAGGQGDTSFERDLAVFENEFGGASFASRRCFADRKQLIGFLMKLSDTTEVSGSRAEESIESATEAFVARVDPERQALARQLLDLGRASHRLRDDDNLHLSRLEALVHGAVEEGRRRLGAADDGVGSAADLEDVARALRHPNLVAEPRPVETSLMVEAGFRAAPRQLVGQPAGPGVANGTARVVGGVDDLFDFRPGEVVVCDAIDPNMTFIVPMAAAVIERRGGMLIHGAIIAREYGLPCVTGIPKVTTLIETGDRLTVDGYLGIVTVSRD
jgi:pyruvate,water dikinase